MAEYTEKRKICIIYTGGTIGMIEGIDGVRRPPEDPSDFLSVVPQVRHVIDFDFVKLLNKDSTNMIPFDWRNIADAIYQRRNKGYTGFLIIHGVDTMAFTASAVAFALGKNLNFPVVFTGGQTMASLAYGDGQINIIRGCKIATEEIAEVVICFNNLVFRATRSQKTDDRDFSGMLSQAFPPLAQIKDAIRIHPFARKVVKYNIKDIQLENNFVRGILPIPLAPSIIPDMMMGTLVRNLCKGVILQSYGGQNVPNDDENSFSFKNFIETAVKETDIPVIVASHFPSDSTEYNLYEPGRDAVDAGAIPISGMVLPALVAKFSWVLWKVKDLNGKQKMDKIRTLMNTIYVGEAGDENFVPPERDEDNYQNKG